MNVHLYSIILITVITYVQCSNILLIFASPSKSHSILGSKLAEGLIKRGHHASLVTPYKISPINNNMTIIQMKTIFEYKSRIEKEFSPDTNKISLTLQIIDHFKKINNLFWNEPGIQKIIQDKPKYDAVIIGIFFNDAVLGIPYHLGVPTIIFSGIGYNSITNRYMANTNVPYAKNPFVNIATDSFFGRLAAVTANALMSLCMDFIINPFQEDLLRKNLPDSPPLEELQKNISLLLLNSHISIEASKPYLPNMIQIGGYHVQNEELPQDIQDFMESATEGAILFSMGSNVLVSTLKKEKRIAILKVLGEMAPMKVLFKSDEYYDSVPENIMVREWLPQADILAHPNLKVFISHGGLGGNTEAVYHGVPFIGMPFGGDQKMNVAEAVNAGYGIAMEYDELTEEVFREKLEHIIHNSTYRENAKKRSALIKEQALKPMDKAAFWIEHIIKYGGGGHLKNDGLKLAWYQLYMIDIFVFYIVLLSLIFVLNYFIMKFFFNMSKKLLIRYTNKVKVS